VWETPAGWGGLRRTIAEIRHNVTLTRKMASFVSLFFCITPDYAGSTAIVAVSRFVQFESFMAYHLTGGPAR